MTGYQNMIDIEQNKIIKRAHSMTNHELLLALVELGHILGLPYLPDREAIIELYCEKMFEKLGL